MLIPPRRIVLSGGGIRAIAHLGALEILEEKGLLKSVREYIGVSAGAFVGFCLVIGYTLSELRTLCSFFDFSLIRNLDPEAALEFPMRFGFDDGANLKKLLHSLLRNKGISITATFEELAAIPKYRELQLRCYATDLFSTSPREFSLSASPKITLVEALRASMSLPGYFTPVEDSETGHLLIDGALLHNFPLSFLKPSEREQAIGISFSYEFTNVKEISDLSVFFSQCFACYYIPRTNEIHDNNKDKCIIIPNGHFPAWNFEATQEEREELMANGRTAALDFLKDNNRLNFQKRKPVRRYSVS